MDNSWQFVLKYMHINSGYFLNWRLSFVKNAPLCSKIEGEICPHSTVVVTPL